jgi:hypothetical protein
MPIIPARRHLRFSHFPLILINGWRIYLRLICTAPQFFLRLWAHGSPMSGYDGLDPESRLRSRLAHSIWAFPQIELPSQMQFRRVFRRNSKVVADEFRPADRISRKATLICAGRGYTLCLGRPHLLSTSNLESSLCRLGV